MKTIKLEDIFNIYNEILQGKITREEAEIFADKLIDAEDNYNLIYIPKSDEKIIWDELIFISGIGMQDQKPDDNIKSYLYNEKDIKDHVKIIENYKNYKEKQ